MEEISSLSLAASQQPVLEQMRRTAASVSMGAGFNIAQADTRQFGIPAQPVSFAKAMSSAIDHVDQMQHVAQARQTAIDTGQSDDLIGTMIESEKASVAFLAMMQVRNKFDSALNEVLNITL